VGATFEKRRYLVTNANCLTAPEKVAMKTEIDTENDYALG
jgi:hypothetical protein